MATKHSFTSEELYQAALENGGQSTAKELAHRYGMKEPNFLAAITKYAVETRKPLPKMAFEKAQTTVKAVRRSRKDKDIRISHLRLNSAGLGHAMAFKVIADPDNVPPRIILIEDTTAPKTLRVTLASAQAPEKKTETKNNKTKSSAVPDDSHLFEEMFEEEEAPKAQTIPPVRRRGRPRKVTTPV